MRYAKCCGTCGLVGLRPKGGGAMVPLTEPTRAGGVFDRSDYKRGFCCLMNLADLIGDCRKYTETECRGQCADPLNSAAVRHVLNIDRSNCPHWIERQPGMSPERHIEMLNQQPAMQALVQIAKIHDQLFQWRQDQADRDDKFSMRIQALEEVRHQEKRKDAANISRKEVRALWLTCIVSAIAALIAAFK